MIHVPLPDDESRIAIVQIFLTKSYVIKDIDMHYLIKLTKGFSAADLRKLSRRACILATREFMEKEQQPICPTTMDSHESPVTEIRREHLEEAVIFTCPSINTNDITKYETLAQQFKESNGLGRQFPFSQGDFSNQSETTGTEDVTI